MSEVTVDTISEANAEIYDRLLVSIEAGIGVLQIFIAVCDADRSPDFWSWRNGVFQFQIAASLRCRKSRST